MEIGDRLRITEIIVHQPEEVITEGKIIAIDQYKVTIEKLGTYGDKFRESLNVADFISKRKNIQINDGEKWERIKIVRRGEKYVCERYRRNNTSCNG